jgi:hypothetical protein
MKRVAAIFLLAPVSIMAQDDAPKPVSMELALKLGPEKLTRIVGGSEAGQDIACQLYAAAKRLQTENRLAKQDLRLVTELDWLRRTLGDCIDGFCSMAYGINGGGTMYTHAESRNDASLEDFLADFSKHPSAGGKGDPESIARLEKLIQYVSKLEIPADIKSDANKEMIEAFLKFRTETVESLNILKATCAESKEAGSKALAGFIISQASWIDYPPEKSKKPADKAD